MVVSNNINSLLIFVVFFIGVIAFWFDMINTGDFLILLMLEVGFSLINKKDEQKAGK